MKLKKLLMPLAVLGALSLNVPAHAGADAYEPLRTITGGQGNVVEYVQEAGSAERNSYIGVMPGAVSASSAGRQWKWCATLDDPVCDPKGLPAGLKTESVLPPCDSPTAENCIESLEVGSPTSLVKASLLRIAGGVKFDPVPKYNFIGGSNISLWNVPGVPSSNGLTTYAVLARMDAMIQNGKFRANNFYAEVVPYREESGSQYQPSTVNTSADATPFNRLSYAQYQQVCVFLDIGKCGVAADYLPDTKVRLKVRLSKDIGGWFDGRLKDPIMDVTNFSTTNSIVTVEATPVTVPRFSLVLSKTNMTDEEKIMYTNNGYWPTMDNGNGSGPVAGDPSYAFPFIDHFRARLNDKATASNTLWNFRTTAAGQGSSCLSDTSHLLGIVSTNAMAYDGRSPSFDNQTLNYRVSGLHFMPDGTTAVQGSYNLVMRSDIARCLYGLSPAPVKATISISGGSDAVVATTSMGEANGWLSLSAAGFTFSEKNIQVKLSQDAPVATPVVAPTMAPATVPATKPVVTAITITCIKGKTTKKVTASKPVCPKGYTKK